VSEIDGYGLAVDLPAGWEGRIFRRLEAGELRVAEVAGAAAPVGERSFPVAHLATIPLPIDMADFGSDVVTDLGSTDALVVVKEFDPVAVGQALFARSGMPRALGAADFDPATLQRRLDGQAGHQTFFNQAGRAFCLYVVVGDANKRGEVASRVSQVLSTFRIDPLEPAAAPTP
jgi:hypothetical protein